MTLLEKVLELHKRTEKIIEENPGIDSITWRILDCQLEEMNKLKNTITEPQYDQHTQRMYFQANFYLSMVMNIKTRCTIWVYSKKVTITKPEFIIEQD